MDLACSLYSTIRSVFLHAVACTTDQLVTLRLRLAKMHTNNPELASPSVARVQSTPL